ncbi:MAG: DnaD domain protein [Clostridia bacterium]|nr:DnaD domain protein [Clostridia bacterium]
MSMFSFDEGGSLYDSTPVDNLFISEYMLHAPGDYVKVYLYALMLCHHPRERSSYEALAKDLDLSVQDVEKAFRYWEREGLARKVGDNPPAYVILTAVHQAFNRSSNPGEQVYNRRFAEEIQRIMGNQVLGISDYQIIYDWVDVLELPEEVVLMLLQNEKKGKKGNISIKIADRKAKEWAQSGVRTVEDVEKIIILGKEREQELKKLLARLGQRRAASQDEKELYRKWVDDWGFTPESIQEACRETTKGTPTMAYLDGILLRQHQNGIHDAVKMQMAFAEEKTIRDMAKQVLMALGRAGTVPTEDDLAHVISWREHGMSDEYIMLGATAAHNRRNNANMEDVETQLMSWFNKGMLNPTMVRNEGKKLKEKKDFLHSVFTDAKIEKSTITEHDISLLDRWETDYGMSRDLIRLAAGYSAGKERPMEVMNKILGDWHAASISTAEAAVLEHEQHQKGSKSSDSGEKKEPEPTGFIHHTDEDWKRTEEALMVDLFGDE